MRQFKLLLDKMRDRRVHTLALVAVVIAWGLGQRLSAQDLSINTSALESLVQEWNFANNTRNEESFRKVYGDELLFYTQELSEAKAIQLKKRLFEMKPYFRQRISTPITYTPYTSGVMKCEFTKEVFEKTHWKKYPSYLLVTYQDRRYSIVGESDNATDRVLKYTLDIGEPMTFESVADDAQPKAVAADSAPLADAPMNVVDSLTALLDSTRVKRMFSDVASMGMVMIPKGYLYMLIGLLTVGGLMIFIADRARSRKPVPEKGASLARHDEAEKVVKDFKMQSVFESFVITLFDPLFFRYKRPKSEPVFAGKVSGTEALPDLMFEYNNKETRVPFAIKCQYYNHVSRNEVQLFPSERLHLLRQFEEYGEMDLYYVLGFGGTPDDPQELFFVPAKAVRSEYISKAVLRQFSKSGMFYYNRAAERIQ